MLQIKHTPYEVNIITDDSQILTALWYGLQKRIELNEELLKDGLKNKESLLKQNKVFNEYLKIIEEDKK